ncbi:HEPN domain-containing protein [Moorellaceae bacterium AZ2]
MEKAVYEPGTGGFMKKQAEAWLKIAAEDLDTAKYNFEGKRYLWAIFLCQQALEKALKAVYYERYEKVPPRKHDLVALAKAAGVLEELDNDVIDYLRRLTVYYIEARYPEEKVELRAKCTEEHTRDIIKQAEEVFQWLASKLN